MNQHTLNGSLLNGGSRSAIVAVVAAVACAASFVANATRVQDALVPSYSSAQFVADATYIHQGQASVSTGSEIRAEAAHTQLAHARLGGQAELQVFVLREIQGQASFEGMASITAIPASILGQSDLGGYASLEASATRVQFARSDLSAAGQFEVQATPVVTRYVVSQVLKGTGTLRAETTINDVGEAYASFVTDAQVSTPDVGIVHRLVYADIQSSADLIAQGTQVQPAKAVLDGISVIVLAEPHITQIPHSYISASVSVEAVGIREVMPDALVQGSSTLSGRASQVHASTQSAWKGGSDVKASALITRYVQARIDIGSASLTANAFRLLVPTVEVLASADLVSHAQRLLYGKAPFLTGVAAFSAQPDASYRYGEAKLLLGYASIEAKPVRELFAFSEVKGGVAVVADMVRVTQGVVRLVGTASLLADTKMNLSSFDPPERTFTRPTPDTEFTRPGGDTLFRRAA